MRTSLEIKSWAEEDRPREKLVLKGKSNLSDAELLAIILGSGTHEHTAVDLAKIILRESDNNLDKLGKLSLSDLTRFKGVGTAKAISIISALEIGRRRKFRTDQIPQPRIRCSQDSYEIMEPYLRDCVHEEFWAILLNRGNYVLKCQKISSGGISGTVADPKIIFNMALQNAASSIILVHNHPSNNPNPSEADNRLTRRLKEAGKLLEMPVLDHLIFCDGSYYSYADDGTL